MNPPEPETGVKAGQVADHWFRHEGARLVAVLTGQLGLQRLQLAEDVVQEALVKALQTWPYRGVPDNPSAWLMQTAKNLALDQLRREKRWREKQDGIAAAQDRWLSTGAAGDGQEDIFSDDTLRLMFVCFHPQLSTEAQTALALRTLCGLSAAEIADAFLTTEAAVSKRLVRARQKIRELELPFIVPEPGDLPARLDGVLGTLYLLFNAGYKASAGDRLVREELCHEAIRLTTLLSAHPATSGPRTFALLALMQLNAARLSARTDDAGNLLRLSEQDRGLWDQAMIRRGVQCLGLAASGDHLSLYHLEAGIAACHSLADSEEATDWTRVLGFYDLLVERTDSPVMRLNRAVAVARVHGPQAGLDAIASMAGLRSLENYHLLHAVLGSLEAELGRHELALGHFQRAASHSFLPSEQDFIARRIRECENFVLRS